MTNEQATEIITLMYDMANNSVSTNTSNAEALDMALRALKNEQTEKEIKERFARKIEYANNDIDYAEETDMEYYYRGYLGGLLCAYRIVFGKSYKAEQEESEDKE